MREVFTLEDIFNVMIELETLGNVHYEKMKDLTDNSKLKVFFGSLAEQELSHKVLYEEFKKEIISYSEEKVDSDYKDYMDVLIDQTVQFLKESGQVTDFDKGFNISIQLEKDTILFLNELRGIVDSNYYEAIDRVITQEKGHLKSLYKFANIIK